MAQKLYREEDINDIGQAIQDALGTDEQFLVSEMSSAISRISSGGFNSGIIASEYSESTSYEIGDYCIYNANLYVCISPTTGTFNNASWTQITVTSELQGIHTDIARLNNQPVLPTPSTSDATKLVSVDAQGQYSLADRELPVVSIADTGKVLKVNSSGVWGADALPAPAPIAPLVVAITYDSQSDEYTADKSHADIKSAISSGREVFAIYDNRQYAYTGTSTPSDFERISFTVILANSDAQLLAKTFTISEDERIVYSQHSLKEELPTVTSADAGKVLTVSEYGTWIPFDAPQVDTWGDVTWDKELVEEWDFTSSLTGTAGDAFTIVSGMTQTSNGLVCDGNNCLAECDLKSKVADWQQVGVRMICESPQWDGVGATKDIAFFGCAHGYFEMSGGAPWNQVFPRDYYSPTVSQPSIFRDFLLDSVNGLYSFNRFMTSSATTSRLFGNFNQYIRDGADMFRICANDYYRPPNGFIFKKLQIWKHL